MAIVPLLQFQLAHGFRPITVERNLRVIGDSLRRIAETSGDTWRSEVLEPLFAAGHTGADIGAASAEVSEGMTALDEQALLAIYRAQLAHVWMANIIGGTESVLARAGLHSRLEHPPAMCFLDITGYTRLTQERGDAAAADLATSWPGWWSAHRSSTADDRSSGWATGSCSSSRTPARGWWPPSRWSRAWPRPGCRRRTSACTPVR